MNKIPVSRQDVNHLEVIRQNVCLLMKKAAAHLKTTSGRVLDIAPQDHEGARPYFASTYQIETIDIDPQSGCDLIGDICQHNDSIPDNTYDCIVCTEVLEHTLSPWLAVQEIYRILKPSGFLLLSVPFNFRIHGPLPDCWRFTEHGLRELLKNFKIEELSALETPDRPLMPIHYTVIARKS